MTTLDDDICNFNSQQHQDLQVTVTMRQVSYQFDQISDGLYLNNNKTIIENLDGYSYACGIGDAIDYKAGSIHCYTITFWKEPKSRGKTRNIGFTSISDIEIIDKEYFLNNGEVSYMIGDDGRCWNNQRFTRTANLFNTSKGNIDIEIGRAHV